MARPVPTRLATQAATAGVRSAATATHVGRARQPRSARPEQRLRRWPRALLWALLTFFAVAASGAYWYLDRWQRQRIFSIETESRRWWGEPPVGTEIFDLRHANGETVRAWYWPSPQPDAPTVLYLHGSRWNLNGSAFRVQGWTTRMGCSLLAIDYRGFGASSPRLPSERSVAADARLALTELARRQPDARRRFVYGHSLGGAIAVDLAAQAEALAAYPVAGLILESTFTNIADLLATFAWGRLPGARWLVTQPFDSRDKIAGLDLPMLFIHGTNDRVIPHAMSDALHEAATRAPYKQLVKLPGVSHSGGVNAGAAYDTAVAQFIEQASQFQSSRLQHSGDMLE